MPVINGALQALGDAQDFNENSGAGKQYCQLAIKPVSCWEEDQETGGAQVAPAKGFGGR